MKLAEIVEILKNNGQPEVANELVYGAKSPAIEALYEDYISDQMISPEPITPVDIVLSPEFAMLRAVAILINAFDENLPQIDIVVEEDSDEPMAFVRS